MCDTLLISDSESVTEAFRGASRRLHLTRNNVFALAAFETAYREGGAWLDGFLDLIGANVERLNDGLSGDLAVMPLEATYLAWLDLRSLGLEVPALARRLAEGGLAFSPGHWFGREGAGFARMTLAVNPETIDQAVVRLNSLISVG